MSEKTIRKGIWIPIRILNLKDLNAYEKILLIEIQNLSSLKQGCFASNQHFANFLHKGINSIQKYLASLEEKGYIHRQIFYKENSKEVDKRILRITKKTETLFTDTLTENDLKND